MAEDMNRRKFLKKTLLGSAGAAAVGLSLEDKTLLAQEDDFNTRIIQDYVYSMHLYRDKLISDK